MAIEGIKSTVKLLTSEQLEPVTRSLFFGLVGRVGGDASTAFLRNEACEAINLLAERAPALALLVCLNDACHNTPSRSLLGRRCLVRCYAAVLPRLLTPSACLSKGNQHSLPTRKHQDTFNRMLPHLASFLRNGDFETRNNGEKILQVLMTNRDFETHLKSLVSDHDRSTFIEAMDKISKRKVLDVVKTQNSFSTPRMPRRPTFRCVTHGRSGSRLFDRRTTTSPPPAPLPLTPRSPLPNEVVQCDYYIDGSKVTMLRLGERERLLSLLKLGAQINESDVPIELSTPEILDLVSPMLRDENEEVVVTALKLCLDARRLDLRNSCCKHYEEKFCPGLLSLLCEREDTEGFTSVLALIYRQLHSKLIAVSNLSRKCLDETRRILGAGALVKPLLQAIHLSTSGTASLVHELCDITADLDVESPLIARHLLPAAAQLLRRCHPLAEAGWRQCNEVDTAEHDAVATFIKCLANLAGVDALHATTAIEGLNNEILQHFLVPD